jgi:hypothetical protein
MRPAGITTGIANPALIVARGRFNSRYTNSREGIKSDMSNAPVKAIAISDRRASSWFSEEFVVDESIECQLLDVEDFLSDIESLESALHRRKKDKLDVIMLDSALPPALLVKMAIRVRDKSPGVPIQACTIGEGSRRWQNSSLDWPMT